MFGVVVPPATIATFPVEYISVRAALVIFISTVPADVEYTDTLCKFTDEVALKTIPQLVSVLPVAVVGGANFPDV